MTADRMTSNTTVAVVGLGYWGPNLLRVLGERNDVELTWLCDLDLGQLERIGRRCPGARLTTVLDHLLDDSELDAIMLATPVDTHYVLGRRCLEAGKHTFIEKPLAPSTEQAAALIALADASDVVLMCGHTFLYSPPVKKVGELIHNGELGDLYFITSSRVNLGLHQRDVSVLWDLGPHDFSIMLHWLDEAPCSVQSIGRDSIVPGIADVAFVTMEFASGLIANVELSWLAPSKLRRTVIAGSRKMVVYEDGGPEPVKIYDRGVHFKDPETFGEWQLSYRTGDIIAPHVSNDEPLSLQTDDFLHAVACGTRFQERLALALEVVRLTEAAQASLEQGGVKVDLPALDLAPGGTA